MSNRRRPVTGATASRAPNSRRTVALVAGIVALCLAVPVLTALALRSGGDSTEDTSVGTVPASVDEVTCADPPAPADDPPSFSQPPDPGDAADAVWEATLHTSCGDVVLELDGKRAPQAVSSFLHLAGEDYWADSPCHRLTTSGIFVLQCGDPTGSGTGNPGYGFGVENAPVDGQYPAGTVAMARSSDPNSNGGQFFLVYDDTQLPTEGGGYTIFGTVARGMAVVEAVAERGVAGGGGDGPPAQPVSLLSVSVEKR